MLFSKQNYLFLNNCFGLNAPDRSLHVAQPPYEPNVVNQTVDYGGTRFKGNPGQGWTVVGMTGSSDFNSPPPDPLVQAQKVLDFQRQANQPVISALQQSGTDLTSKYNDLVSSIRGNAQVASDRQTLATSNELGKRGILPSSGLYQQEQANAQLPITAQTNSQLAQTGMNQQSDLTNLALEISRLQAGDVPSAISAGQNYSNSVQQANQFQQDLFLRQQEQQQQADQYQQTYQLQQQQANKAPTQIVSIGGHEYLINTQTGQKISDLGATGSGSSSTALKSADYVTALNSAITQKNTLSNIYNAFSPYLPAAQIVQQYNALSPYGQAKEPWAQALVGNKPSSTDSLIQSYLDGL